MENYKIKEPVKLKQRELKDGTISLFLEIHSNGRRRYEFLKLYLVKEHTKADKQANARTIDLAEAIRARRVLELRNNKYGFTTYDDGKAELFPYMLKHAERATKHGETTELRSKVVINLLKKYAGRDTISFNEANNKDFAEGFIMFMNKYKAKEMGCITLNTPHELSPNTKHLYFSIFMSILNKAARDGIIARNEAKRVDEALLPKKIKTEKAYLTKDELKRLIETQYGTKNIIRNMFLFGCATGLRFSDIVSLKWSNLTDINGRIYFSKKQIKTENLITAPLSAMALRLLPKRREGDNGFVFKEAPDNECANIFLKKWVARAGITKKITFHSSRHTFATLILSEGADLYTVSKLLGHSDIKTTQIYAKIVDESKNKAIDLLPDFLEKE